MVELPSAAGYGGCPDGVGAAVLDFESGCMDEGEEEREDEEAEGSREVAAVAEEAHFGVYAF